METLAFYFFGTCILLLSIFVIISRHPAYAVLYLLASMFCLAGLYVLLGAYFVATLQIVLYAGAVLVMFLFVVMLLSLREEGYTKGRKLQRSVGVVVSAFLFIGIVAGLRSAFVGGTSSGPVSKMVGSITDIGELLFTKYLFPFEVTSLLILAAMIGAIVIAKQKMGEGAR